MAESPIGTRSCVCSVAGSYVLPGWTPWDRANTCRSIAVELGNGLGYNAVGKKTEVEVVKYKFLGLEAVVLANGLGYNSVGNKF